ncbi:MAG: carbohydrate binding domain-containing protein [Spirochaetes bacterium]|nr:carbohydrate binding domain-containing protein [Spirochaetota bacterium]
MTYNIHKRFLTVCIAIFTAGFFCSAAESLSNISFEDAGDEGALHWKNTGAGGVDAAFARDTASAHSGTASMRITVPPTDKQSWPSAFQRIAVKEGETYILEAYVKTADVTRGAYISGDCFDESGKRLSYTGTSLQAGTSDWKKYFVTVVVPPKATVLQFTMILFGAGTAWFDDVSMRRDEKAAQLAAELAKPLPAEWFKRAVVSDGNVARIKRAFAKAAAGKVTVGVIGGSITQGASASTADKRYAGHMLAWWKRNFPAAECTLINAGIGATGSDYGSMRIQRDLLSKKPDFIVVEYAVNDGNTQERAESYEGVIRQIMADPGKPGVLLMFMVNEAGGNAQEWESKIGTHYGIPMVSYRDLVWPELAAKRIVWRDISPDNIHPNDIGHAYAGKLIGEMLDRIKAMPDAAADAAALPAPLLTDKFQYTMIAEADALTPAANEGWTLDTTQANKCYKSAVPGSVIEFDVTGDKLFLSYWVVKGPMGKAKITVDDGDPRVEDSWFDQTWGGYRRMIMISDGKPGKHRVRVEVLADKNPKSTGNEFRLLMLGAAGVR